MDLHYLLRVCLVLLVAAPVSAQPSLLPTVEQIRAEFPTPMSDAQRGELLNRVAWAHRLDGWGLHLKPQGARCPQPGSGQWISCDLLVHAPTLAVFDVLIDGDGEARPSWSLVGPINTMSNFVSPTGTAGPAPSPIPPAPVPVETDLTPILDLMAGLERQIGTLRVEHHQDHEATRGQIALLATQIEGLILPPAPVPVTPAPPVEVPSAWGRAGVLLGKYVLPVVVTAISTYFAARGEPEAVP